MISAMLLAVLTAQADPATGSSASFWVDKFGAVVIAGIVSIVTIYVTGKFGFKGKDKEVQGNKYASDLEQLAKQKEFVIKENADLWAVLKEELDSCREERDKNEAIIENLTKRVTKVEAELTAYELGIKVPAGFRLVKIAIPKEGEK